MAIECSYEENYILHSDVNSTADLSVEPSVPRHAALEIISVLQL